MSKLKYPTSGLSPEDVAALATARVSEDEASIRRISGLNIPELLLNQKVDSPAVTGRSFLPSAAQTRDSTCYYSSPPTTGQLVSTLSVILGGPFDTASPSTLVSESPKSGLPKAPTERKQVPLWSGLVKYFPDALAAVAAVSFAGNDQHHPGKPLHWDRNKSTDQEDALLRHLWESGTVDTDGHRHSAKAAWRALALLQLELERATPSGEGKP